MAVSSNALALRSASHEGRSLSRASRLCTATSSLSYPLSLVGATLAGVVGSIWSSQTEASDTSNVEEALPTADSASPELDERPSAGVPRLELDLGRPFDSDAPLLGSDLPAPSPSLAATPLPRPSRQVSRATPKKTAPLVRFSLSGGRLPLSGRPGAKPARVTLTPLSASTAPTTTAASTAAGIRAICEKAEKQLAQFEDLTESFRKKLDLEDSLAEARTVIYHLQTRIKSHDRELKRREEAQASELEEVEQQRRRDEKAHLARVRELQDQLNAVVADRAQRAKAHFERERELQDKLDAITADRDRIAKDSRAALDAAAAEVVSYKEAYEEIHGLATAEVAQLHEQIAVQAQEKEMILLKGKELQDERDQLLYLLRSSGALRASENSQATVAAPVDVHLAPQVDEMDCDDFDLSSLPPPGVVGYNNNHNPFQVLYPAAAVANPAAAVAPPAPAFAAPAPAFATPAPAFAPARAFAPAAASFALARATAPPSPPALPVYRAPPSPTAPRYPSMVSEGWIEGKMELRKAMKEAKADARKWLDQEREKQQRRVSKFDTALLEPKQLPATAKRRAREDDRDDLKDKRFDRFYEAMIDSTPDPEP